MTINLKSFFHFGWAPNKPYRADESILTKQVQQDTDYTLAFIEFDDQGWYHDIRQRNALQIYLDKHDKIPHLVIVFVHGWKHNASVDDPNVLQAMSLLEKAAISEKARGKERKVLGVYLGWRGFTLRMRWIENLTFWDRKDTAFRVAVGSCREILAMLKRFRDGLDIRGVDARPNAADTRLITVGHSFGGLILFSALSEYLIESTLAANIISPFGDLVMLVNPAFEATRYQAITTALERRNFESKQRSVFVTFSASNDLACGVAFPVGRWFSTLWEATRQIPAKHPVPADAQRQANLKTIGHLSWLRTHRLCLGNDDAGALSQASAQLDFQTFNGRFRSGGRLARGWHRRYKSGAELKHVAGDPNNPFWIVEATPEVINGHGGIFQPVFVDFLAQFIEDRLTPL